MSAAVPLTVRFQESTSTFVPDCNGIGSNSRHRPLPRAPWLHQAACLQPGQAPWYLGSGTGARGATTLDGLTPSCCNAAGTPYLSV